VNSLNQHPGERGQEEVVQEACHGGAQSGVLGGVETEDQQNFGAKKTDAEVAMDRRAVAA